MSNEPQPITQVTLDAVADHFRRGREIAQNESMLLAFRVMALEQQVAQQERVIVSQRQKLEQFVNPAEVKEESDNGGIT